MSEMMPDTANKPSFKNFEIFCLMTLTTVAIAAALIYTKTVLLPFVLAVFYYYASLPLVNLLERKKIPNVLAVVITFLVVALFSVGIFLQIAISLRKFVMQADDYKRSFISFLNVIADLLANFNIKIKSDSLIDMFQSLPLVDMARQLTGSAISFLGTTFLVIIIYFFLMVGKAKGSADSPLRKEIEQKVSSYIIYKVLISIITGTFVGTLLILFDVELAFMFGVLTALLNLIPNIGSIVATALPLPIILLQFGFGFKFFMIFFLISFVQFLIGNIIEPKIIGKDLDLHPVAILLSLIFWGLIWGIGGAFLAVPMTAVIKLILAKQKETQRIGEILAGRI